MKLPRNTLLSLLILALVSLTSPSAVYGEMAGKTKNATIEQVTQALVDTLKATEDALNALHTNAPEEQIQGHISDARKFVKAVEINRLDVIRTRASEKLKNARHALGKGETKQAEAYLSDALKGFQEMQRLL